MTHPTPGPTTGSGRRFHLQQRIGAGAFGEVFLAEQDSGAGFRRRVALKVLNAQAVGSHDAARRMRDEARILGRLSHRHIVGVLDLVRLGDRWAVVMDYVEGADVEQVEMALYELGETVPPPAAFEIGAAVCRALHAAWHADDGRGGQLQVVHRDIKPSNIRLTTDGEVKVLDFGVARVSLDTREAQTRAEGWIGTERYMAPERILMEGDGPWGDVYATGASIIEMILVDPLGRTPVLPERHDALVEQAIARVRARLEGPPEAVDRACALLAASVAADPQARPTAETLSEAFSDLARDLQGEDLARFCRRIVTRVPEILGSQAEPVDGVLSEGSAPASVASSGSMAGAGATFIDPGAPPEAPAPDGPPRRRTGLVIGALAAVAVVLVGLLVVLVGGGALVATLGWSATQPVPEAPSAVDQVPPAPAPVEAPPPAEVEAPEPAEAAPETTPADDAPPPAAEEAPEPETASAPAPSPAISPDAPRISAAAFSVQDADALTVTCGDTTRTGTASVRLRDLPAGPCRIRAVYLGETITGTVDVQRRMAVQCTVDGERLTCAD